MGKKYLLAVTACAFVFTACGDDVTEVNEIHQDGIAVLEAGLELLKQKCGTDNVGEMLYVTDSAEVYFCDGKSWQTTKGADGENGKDGVGKDGAPGKDGNDGDDGASCAAKTVTNEAGLMGLEVTCGKTVVGTIWNGEKGEDGDDGENGVGCSVNDEGDGTVTVSCGEDETTLYKAVCGTAAYDPAKSFCSEGEVYELCGGKTYDPKKQFCDTRDNQIYGYVTIAVGDYAETWMAENLNYSVNPGVQSWCGGGEKETTNEGDCAVYGRLYTWAAAMDSVAAFSNDGKGCGYGAKCDPSGTVRGICPEGWHLPSYDEWDALITAVGGTDVAGKKLKADSDLWTYEEGISNDDSYGFSALPAGYRSSNGYFGYAGGYALFWSASERFSDIAYHVSLFYRNELAGLDFNSKIFGVPVRCLQNN